MVKEEGGIFGAISNSKALIECLTDDAWKIQKKANA